MRRDRSRVCRVRSPWFHSRSTEIKRGPRTTERANNCTSQDQREEGNETRAAGSENSVTRLRTNSASSCLAFARCALQEALHTPCVRIAVVVSTAVLSSTPTDGHELELFDAPVHAMYVHTFTTLRNTLVATISAAPACFLLQQTPLAEAALRLEVALHFWSEFCSAEEWQLAWDCAP